MVATHDLRHDWSLKRAAVLRLNNAHAQELSWLEVPALDAMVAGAFLARAVGALDAFMIAFDQDADYGSPNFLWFRERFPRFVYVDRVVVAPSARGQGLARMLYADIFAAAAADGHARVACEVNSLPPNPASDAFHAGMGFRPAGSAEIDGGLKTVRYLVRDL
jgi:predicted GNAT superfamily acetyltransferase